MIYQYIDDDIHDNAKKEWEYAGCIKPALFAETPRPVPTLSASELNVKTNVICNYLIHDICHFFSTYTIFGNILIHAKVQKHDKTAYIPTKQILQQKREIYSHVESFEISPNLAKFQISTHLWCGRSEWICMWRNFIFLHIYNVLKSEMTVRKGPTYIHYLQALCVQHVYASNWPMSPIHKRACAWIEHSMVVHLWWWIWQEAQWWPNFIYRGGQGCDCCE